MAEDSGAVPHVRALIVEDDPADAEFTCETLREGGIEADCTVVGGRDSLERALEGPGTFDVVLADYTIPGFGGPEALEILKKRRPDVPVVFVSGTVGEERAVELLQNGAVDYVLKDRMSRLPFAVERALAHASEVARRRRSERLYQLLAENVADVLWVLDVNSGHLDYVSPSIERLTGFTPEEVMARPLDDSVVPGSAEEMLESMAGRVDAYLAGDRSATTRMHRAEQPCKDGHAVCTEILTTISTDDKGCLQLLGVTRDITQRVQVEQALDDYRANLERIVAERTDELKRANAAKGEFLASMGHELRTPLNSIIGFADLMLAGMAGEVSGEQREHLGVILEAGKHLLAVINDILDLSKLDASRVEPHPAAFDACLAVRDATRILTPIAAGKCIDLAVECPEGGVPAFTDRRLLTQILLNLVANAIKFTDRGGVTVRVAGSGGRLVFEVEDTGCGIAEDDLDGIFHDFGRGKAARPDIEGTGLGLAISRRLAVLLGGTLTAVSEVGRGSTFTLDVRAESPRSAEP
ncbi:MAG: PAS domain S-box protein [Actinobacteria bacterium]|nr:MAG: PAS domain S-box protein [Actinomycetota bacterium]